MIFNFDAFMLWTWKCPKCSTNNINAYPADTRLVCRQCHTPYWWQHVLTDEDEKLIKAFEEEDLITTK